MPVMECTYYGLPGYKYGEQGKCYTYVPGNEEQEKQAKQKAVKQGLAITGGTLEDIVKDNVRIDYYPFDDLTKNFERFKITPEGYLRGNAIVTNIGVFPYVMADGSIQMELRSPEEVFNDESMATLKMIPLTNEHPDTKVTKENIKNVQVGFTGDSVFQDQYHLGIPITVTDIDAIDDIKLKKRGLSSGYMADVVYQAGVWMGIHYDAVQKNIRYNHIALVDKSRAGDDCKLKLDSINTKIGILKIDSEIRQTKKINKGETNMSLKKIKLDGVEYEAEAKVIEAYTQTKSELEKLKNDHSSEIEKIKKDNAKIQAERDQFEEESKKLKEDFDELKKKNPEELEQAIQKRLIVLDAAKRAKIEIKADQSELELKKDIIEKIFPNSKEKLEKADESYIEARFDGVLETLETMEKENEETQEALKSDSLANVNDEIKHDSSTAYKKMVERIKNSWKKDKEEVN